MSKFKPKIQKYDVLIIGDDGKSYNVNTKTLAVGK